MSITAHEAYGRLYKMRREIYKVACIDIEDVTNIKLVMSYETWVNIATSVQRWRDDGLVVLSPTAKFGGFDVAFDERLEPDEMVFRNEIKIP